MFRKLAGLTAVAGLFFAGSAFADIANSAHDLSQELDLGTTGDEICVVCHAPHGNVNDAGDMLWNHTPSAETYTPYASLTLDGTSVGPGPVSVLCLSCHDGTISVDSYGTLVASGTNFVDVVATFGADAPAAFGADLGNDHPVGVNYNNASDAELRLLTTDVGASFGTPETGATIADMLFTGLNTVECGTCHDVHATRSGNNESLLVIANAGSALCTTCHLK